MKYILLCISALCLSSQILVAKQKSHTKGDVKMTQEHIAPFHSDIYKEAELNNNFRKVLATGQKSQIVVMSIPVGGEIGQETHPHTDQTLIFVEGTGIGILNGKEFKIKAHDIVLVPAGTQHNFVNTGSKALKLFTIYAPPAHRTTTVHKTKEDADKDKRDKYK